MAPQAQTMPLRSNDHVQEQMSQSSDENSQPPVAEPGDRTLSPTRSDDIFGPSSDARQVHVRGNDSPPGGDQQQDDAQQDQISREWRQYPELQLDRPEHIVRQEVLERHPELRLRPAEAIIQDISDDSAEELALINVPESNVIPTFLIMAARETEPLEPKTLRQAKNDPSWPEWVNGMVDEVRSLKQNRTWELADPPEKRRVLSGKWVFRLK